MITSRTDGAGIVLKTLPACYYTDPELFRREIAGESIIVVRSDTGSIGAFYNVCRHRGTRLCSATEGNFAGRIQCPYHGWTYGLDGRLLGAPHMDLSVFEQRMPIESRAYVPGPYSRREELLYAFDQVVMKRNPVVR